MALSWLKRRASGIRAETVEALYGTVVAQARRPEFYREHEVPDTLDGRFEMIGLHVFLVMNRLRSEGEPGREMSQALTDRFFDDLDRSLREMGAGDLGVGRRVKTMAKAFYGRIAAYQAAMATGAAGLEGALARNLYGTVAPAPESVAAMAGYVKRAAAALAAEPFARLARGEVRFGALP